MAELLIAGGGIAGLAAAIGAARAGHQVCVLERQAVFSELGAGIQIGPNGRRALEELGAWQWLQHHVVHPRAIRIRRAASGTVLSELPLDEPFRRRFRTTYQVVHRADLLAALLAAAEQESAITLHTDRMVMDWHQQQGRVVVSLQDGEERGADALIGADGIFSRVRARLLGEQPPRPNGHVLYRALVPRDEVPSTVDMQTVQLWLHPGGHVVHYPVKGGQAFNIIAAINQKMPSIDEAWGRKTDASALHRVFSNVCDELHTVLEVPRQWMCWAGVDRPPAPRWSRGNVTLIGDAAHPMLPYLASGAVMALEDAVVLMRHLAMHAEPAQAFAAYERERRPRTTRVVRAARRMGHIYHAPAPLALARDAVLRASTPARDLQRMAWLYDWRP